MLCNGTLFHPNNCVCARNYCPALSFNCTRIDSKVNDCSLLLVLRIAKPIVVENLNGCEKMFGCSGFVSTAAFECWPIFRIFFFSFMLSDSDIYCAEFKSTSTISIQVAMHSQTAECSYSVCANKPKTRLTTNQWHLSVFVCLCVCVRRYACDWSMDFFSGPLFARLYIVIWPKPNRSTKGHTSAKRLIENRIHI